MSFNPDEQSKSQAPTQQQAQSIGGDYRDLYPDSFLVAMRRQRADLQERITLLTDRVDVLDTIIDAMEG